MTSDLLCTWDSPNNSPKTTFICLCSLIEIVSNLFELLQINKPTPDPLEKFKTMDSNFTIQELEDFYPTEDFAKTVASNIVYVVGAALGGMLAGFISWQFYILVKLITCFHDSWIYESTNNSQNFLCFVFLQGRSFLLRLKMPI